MGKIVPQLLIEALFIQSAHSFFVPYTKDLLTLYGRQIIAIEVRVLKKVLVCFG